MIVLDASVALKWLVPGETDRDAALKVLDRVLERPEKFAAPELLFMETAAVLARAQAITLTDRKRYVTYLEELGLHRVGAGHEVLQTALELSDRWKLSACDCIYLATATLMQGQWLTADERALKRVRAKGLVLSLADWRG